MSSVPQIEALRTGELDVAIINGIPKDEGIASIEIWREPLVALVSRSHGASQKRSVSVSALAADSFVMFPRLQAPQLYDQIMSLCRKGGFEPAVAQEAQSWHMIAELVGAGMGVSIVPSSVRRYRVPRVSYVSLRSTESVSMTVCRSRANTNEVAKLFVEIAKELVKVYPQSGQRDARPR
jgi:DNA-binding transcriptional LysR family regulator